jgi:hypothetical protein
MASAGVILGWIGVGLFAFVIFANVLIFIILAATGELGS